MRNSLNNINEWLRIESRTGTAHHRANSKCREYCIYKILTCERCVWIEASKCWNTAVKRSSRRCVTKSSIESGWQSNKRLASACFITKICCSIYWNSINRYALINIQNFLLNKFFITVIIQIKRSQVCLRHVYKKIREKRI